MQKISIYLSISFVIIAFIVGIGLGYSFTPQYSLSMYDKNTMDLGRADKWIDLRYINAMIAHHRGAILVAEQGELSTRPEVKNLAAEIQKNEPVLIDELYKWKKDWYGDTKKVKDPIVPNLGTHNDTFDLRFLNAVISHHENGVLMTKEIRIKSSRNEILDNANNVEKFLIDSGLMLKEWRKNWYNV